MYAEQFGMKTIQITAMSWVGDGDIFSKNWPKKSTWNAQITLFINNMVITTGFMSIMLLSKVNK